MTARRPVSKKLRFEVFKRDSFKCQYCGEKAPDVLLVIDHIEPVSKGGTNDLLNLITSCQSCNSGKSDRKLSDKTILDKQRQQLGELQERREQIDMMFQWQKGLLDLDEQVVLQLSEYWREQVPGFSLSEECLKGLRRLQRQYTVQEIMTAMKIAAEQYIQIQNGEPKKESVERAWKKVGGICTVRKREKENPDEQRLYYIRGILRKRLAFLNEEMALRLLRKGLRANVNIRALEEVAKSASNWTTWRSAMEELLEEDATP